MKLVKWYNGKPGLYNDNWSNFFNEDFVKPAFPAVNIQENDGGYTLELAAPGLKKDDFKIDLDKDILTVSVSREEEQNEDKSGYTRREFRFSSFKRSFVLPETVDSEQIKGSYENGILNVQLPKKAEVTQPKKVIAVA